MQGQVLRLGPIGMAAQAPGAGHLTRRQATPTGTGVDQLAMALAGPALGGQGYADLFARAGAAIDPSRCLQALQGLGIERFAGRLPLRRCVGQQAAAAELLQDQTVGAGRAARLVDVLDADQPSPAMGSRIQPTGQGGHQRARMQRAGGRGGEATDIGGLGGCEAGGSQRIKPSCCSSKAWRVLALCSCCSHQLSAKPGGWPLGALPCPLLLRQA